MKCKFCDIQMEGEFAYRGMLRHLETHDIYLDDILGNFIKEDTNTNE